VTPLTIPEAFAATGIVFIILAAVTFVAIVTADQYGKRPELWRNGLRLTVAFVGVGALSFLSAIWSAVLA
jgi:ABC-type multidrug transport system permease subunit